MCHNRSIFLIYLNLFIVASLLCSSPLYLYISLFPLYNQGQTSFHRSMILHSTSHFLLPNTYFLCFPLGPRQDVFNNYTLEVYETHLLLDFTKKTQTWQRFITNFAKVHEPFRRNLAKFHKSFNHFTISQQDHVNHGMVICKFETNLQLYFWL